MQVKQLREGGGGALSSYTYRYSKVKIFWMSLILLGQEEIISKSDNHDPGGTSILGGWGGGGGAWPQILPLKFLLEPQILPPKI